MGRKDAARFIILEKKVKLILDQQLACMEAEAKIEEKYRQSLIMLRDIYNKLIEGD